MGGGGCCSRAVYTVDDEGLEEDCAVGRGASQFVNHSYSRSCTPGETTQEKGGIRREEGGQPRQTWRGGGGDVGGREERVMTLYLKVAWIFNYLIIYRV